MIKKILCFCVIIGLVALIFLFAPSEITKKIMAEPVWGLLQKAQDDNETIEDAIARLITAHLADADAHAGDGESLAVHKTQDELDHKVGSVVTDKLTNTEVTMRSNFESLDGWGSIGSVSLESIGWAQIYVEDGAVMESEMYGVMEWANWFDFTRNMLIQATMSIGISPTYTVYLALGPYLSAANVFHGFGFKFTEDGVIGFFKEGTTYRTTSILADDNAVGHVYRVQYNATTDELKYYIDGELKATLALTGTPPSDSGYVRVNAVPGAGSDGNVNMHEIVVTYEL